MTDTQFKEPVTLVLERDVPVRMTRNGVRYYVDGAPEPLGRTVATKKDRAPLPAVVTGWRFRGTSVAGESHLFEVVARDSARWNLRAVRDE
ncbi:hypothetical protein [Diaminobutyricibacter sp. McL0608]|uniref:hypothetical protein n=1 Tax=Leifsonia sp. McL0608 TaxID=3143537 RepID=UPI0031F2EF40